MQFGPDVTEEFCKNNNLGECFCCFVCLFFFFFFLDSKGASGQLFPEEWRKLRKIHVDLCSSEQ